MQSHPPAMFVADALGLDFINSIATPVDTPVDWIADGGGLLRWLAQAKLVPSDVLDELKARATPGELDGAAGQARDLREWFRGFVRKHMGPAVGAAGAQGIGAAEPAARNRHWLQQDRAASSR
ncbi:hypothetical protein ACVWY2_007480 [Bradyrhizobium sp. JR6.1]